VHTIPAPATPALRRTPLRDSEDKIKLLISFTNCCLKDTLVQDFAPALQKKRSLAMLKKNQLRAEMLSGANYTVFPISPLDNNGLRDFTDRGAQVSPQRPAGSPRI
jgi:hypothetical protein